MKTVKEILDAKPHEVWSVTPNATVLDALKLMSEKEIGALMVIDESGAVCGIVSERDYARKVVLLGRHSNQTAVEEIMTPEERMWRVSSANTIEECMVLMAARNIRHLPVYENERFIGFLSVGDVVNALINEKQDLIEKLNDYISAYSMAKHAWFPGEGV